MKMMFSDMNYYTSLTWFIPLVSGLAIPMLFIIGKELSIADISVSSKNVLRGIHGDQNTWKLISCLEGEFYLVVINNDENSFQYKLFK